MATRKEIRLQVYAKYGNRCSYCGEPIAFKDMQVDHLIPQASFQTHIANKYKIPQFLTHLTISDVNHIDNLMPACRVCNKWKDAHSLWMFREELSEQVKRLHNYSSNFRIAKKYGLLTETNEPIVFWFEKYDSFIKPF